MAAWIPKTVIQAAKSRNVCVAAYGVQVCSYSTTRPRIIKNPTPTSLKRGTGGRSSFNGIVCTVFGASGFIGQYLCNQLASMGSQVIIPYRFDKTPVQHLKVCGDLGQILFQEFNLKDEESIYKCIKYSNVVINVLGRNYETHATKYEDAHVHGARTIARICKENNVERLIHFSCLNANPNPPEIFIKGGSNYLKAKWAGEQAVKEEFPDATIVKPSEVFGEGDTFLLSYTSDSRLNSDKMMPVFRKAKYAEKQPVYIHDVVDGVKKMITDRRTMGKTYQFIGPNRYTLYDMVLYIYKMTYYHEFPVAKMELCHIEDCPSFIGRVYWSGMAVREPWLPIHWELLEFQHQEDVVDKRLPTLEDLGVKLTPLENRIVRELSTYVINPDGAMRLLRPPADPPTIPTN